MKDRLSRPMLRVLRHLANGRPPSAHCRTQSDYGGLEGTVRALERRRLIAHYAGNWILTAAGQAAEEAHRAEGRS